MQPISATDAIGLAFTHTRSVLAPRPFRPGRFFKLAFVAALTQATFLSVSFVYPLQGGEFAFLSHVHQQRVQQQFASGPFASGPGMAALGIGVLAVLLLLVLLFSVAIVYLVCRLRVTLFDLVVNRGGRVRPAWRRYPRAARRYFVLFLVATVAWWTILAAVLGPFFVAVVKSAMAQAHPGGDPSQFSAAIASQVVVLAGLFWLLLPIWLAIDALLQDFLLPALALEPLAPLRAAFSRLGSLARRAPLQLLLFLTLRTVVALGVALALGLVALVLVGALGLGLYGVGHLAYNVLWPGGLGAHTVFFAVAAGLVLLVLAVYLAAVLAIYGVTGVFKTSYAAIFFAGYYPELAALLAPPPEEASLVEAGPFPPLPPLSPLEAKADIW